MQTNLTEFEFQEPRVIKGFENYTISVNGDVFSKIRCRYLSPVTSDTGYCYVRLKNKQGEYKQQYIHRLVAEAFLIKPNPNYKDVNHIDGNRSNNHLDNLQWVSHQENIKHSFDEIGRDLSYNSKSIYIPELDRYFKSQSDAARFLGCNQSLISAAITHNRKAKGYTIIYASKEPFIPKITKDDLKHEFINEIIRIGVKRTA